MLRDLPPIQTKNTGKCHQKYRQRAKQITAHAPTPYGSIPSRRTSTRNTRKQRSSSSAAYAPYPYFDNDVTQPSSSLFASLLGRLLSVLPITTTTTSSSSASNNNNTSPVVGFMPRSPSVTAPPLDVSLPITIASSNNTATDDSCSCLSTSLSSSCGSLSSSATSSTACSSCSSIMSASLFLASEDSLSDLLCDRYRQPKEAKVTPSSAVVGIDGMFRNKAPPPPDDDGDGVPGAVITSSTNVTQSPAHQQEDDESHKPSVRARDLRVNGAHLRMIVAEANMMRADKIIGPLRPRGSLPKRSDEFVPSKPSHLRYHHN